MTVIFDPKSEALTCTFLDQFKSDTLSCVATLYSGENCEHYVGPFNSTQTANDVRSIVLMLENATNYCYTINASNGTQNVIIEGVFNLTSKI